MANEIVSLASASLSSVVANDMSGRKAALPHEEASVSNIDSEQNLIDDKAISANQHSGMFDKDEGKSARQFLEKQAQNLQDLSDIKGWNVSFRVDEDLNQTIIRVVDADTQKTIRQIPSEEMLSLSKRLEAIRDSNNSSDLSGLLYSSEI